MKRLNSLLLLLCFFSTAAFSQITQIKIVSFQVKNTLPAKVDDWNTVPAALILTAQKSPGVQLKEPKLVVQIRSNGAIVCGNNQSTAQSMASFDVKTFTTNELTGMLINCPLLKEGSYQICAQFFNIDRIAISNEVCKEFKGDSQKLEEYAPPTLITPEDGKKFTEGELSRPLIFRWTPLVPKPQQPITYRLKVWQLMQGQNGAAAMRSNPPIVTKDVDNITQAVISSIYTGPCRPPYLCDYVWQVQALNKDGKPVGNNEGKSEMFRFGLQETGSTKPPTNISPENGTQFRKKSDEDAKLWELKFEKSSTFRWTPVIPKPQEPVTYRLKVWQLMQGQNGAAAIRTNKPIVVKDVDNITEAAVSGIYTGPCRPPYLCDYVWNVQALDKAGKPIGENEGTSETWLFKIVNDKDPKDPPQAMMMGGANAVFKIDSAICLKKEGNLFRYHIWAHYENLVTSVNNILLNDVQPFAGYIANPNPGPGLNLRNNIRIKAGPYNGALTINDILEASSGTISSILPTPVTFPAQLVPNSIQNFQFDYSTATNSPVQFTFYGLVDDGLKGQANRNSRNEYDSLKYPQCPCNACDSVLISANQTGEITQGQGGTLGLNVNLISSPKKVKRIRAELVYFDMKPENENCLICNKESNTFGNFVTNTTTNPNFTPTLPYPHSAQFDALTATNIAGGMPLNFTIVIPPMVSCCNAEVNFCIRYVLTFEDCTSCNVQVCYKHNIKGCSK